MNNVVPIRQKIYSNFAERFVDLWFDYGRQAAGLYAVEHIRREEFPAVKPYVDEAFLRRGYDTSIC